MDWLKFRGLKKIQWGGFSFSAGRFESSIASMGQIMARYGPQRLGICRALEADRKSEASFWPKAFFFGRDAMLPSVNNAIHLAG